MSLTSALGRLFQDVCEHSNEEEKKVIKLINDVLESVIPEN